VLVDRRVSLQEVLEATVAQTGCPPLGADDAHGDGLTDAHRITDRQDDVSDPHGVGVAKRQRSQAAGIDLQHREVARGIGPDDLGLEATAIGQFDVDVVGTVDDVMVGQDVAVLADDDAGTERCFSSRLGLRPAAATAAATASSVSTTPGR